MWQVQCEGLASTIGYFEAYQNRIEDKLDIFIRTLADIGIDAAKTQFNSFNFIDNPKPVDVHAEPTEKGIAVVASGEQVAFIEFGTGVFYNGSESYAGVRPPNVLGIGEFGHGWGKRNAWHYKDANGEDRITRGNPPSNSMWYASETILKVVEDIAKVVFNDD